MRPIYFLIFISVSALNLLQSAAAEHTANRVDEIPLEDIEILSDVWPRFVNLRQSFQIPDSDKIIKPNYRGTLMRVEGNNAVINFGRYGTHWIHIKETNLVSGIREMLDTDKWKKGGLFQNQMFNKFFKHKDERFVQSNKDDIYIFDYFLLLYADLKTEESEAIVLWLLKNKELLDKLSCSLLLMPMDSTEKELLDDMRELNWKYPSVYQWMYEGHKKSLAFDPTPNPSIILIDGSGRMVSRGSSVDFLNSIANFIDKDKKKMDEIRKKYKLKTSNSNK